MHPTFNRAQQFIDLASEMQREGLSLRECGEAIGHAERILSRAAFESEMSAPQAAAKQPRPSKRAAR